MDRQQVLFARLSCHAVGYLSAAVSGWWTKEETFLDWPTCAVANFASWR